MDEKDAYGIVSGKKTDGPGERVKVPDNTMEGSYEPKFNDEKQGRMVEAMNGTQPEDFASGNNVYHQ